MTKKKSEIDLGKRQAAAVLAVLESDLTIFKADVKGSFLAGMKKDHAEARATVCANMIADCERRIERYKARLV